MKELRMKLDIYVPFEGDVVSFNNQKTDNKIEEAAELLKNADPKSISYQIHEVEAVVPEVN